MKQMIDQLMENILMEEVKQNPQITQIFTDIHAFRKPKPDIRLYPHLCCLTI